MEPASLSLSDVILGMRAALGGWGLRGFLSTALVLLVYRRLGEILRRMEGLAGRFRAGRVWRRGARAGDLEGVAAVAVRRAQGGRLWPRSFGWLVRAASWQAAGFGSQLRAVLAQPEMVALLVAAPQAARVLRPLCRMLAIEASVLRPGVAVVAPGEGVVRVPRVRKPRVAVDWGRIPMSREIVLAARRDGFLKGG